jgi:glycosyltransferase involved in cell wall biosynthesis
MKLAFFSPLSPQKSGIADYSEELLPYLAEQAEIDLFVEGFKPTNQAIVERFRIFDYVADPSCLRRLGNYDGVVYHLGNDHRYHAGIYDAAREHPGIVVLHDFALQDFFLGLARTRGDFGIYLDEMEASHGARAREEAALAFERGGLPAHVAAPLLFPLNRSIVRAAEAVIVHSQWSRARLQNLAPGLPVARINHHITARAAEQTHNDDALNAEATNSAVRSDADVVSICSFGLITPDKGIERALRALAALKDEHAFHYTLVGAPNSFFDVRELIARYGLSDRVTITGHVSRSLSEGFPRPTSPSTCASERSAKRRVASAASWPPQCPRLSLPSDGSPNCPAIRSSG